MYDLAVSSIGSRLVALNEEGDYQTRSLEEALRVFMEARATANATHSIDAAQPTLSTAPQPGIPLPPTPSTNHPSFNDFGLHQMVHLPGTRLGIVITEGELS